MTKIKQIIDPKIIKKFKGLNVILKKIDKLNAELISLGFNFEKEILIPYEEWINEYPTKKEQEAQVDTYLSEK